MTVPFHIVAGFLGAGKTTVLLEQLKRFEDERVAVIVNDFGESAYDASRLGANTPTSIREIPGGCVCCTAPEGFIDALHQILETNPDRIFVEPTGLALPGDLLDTVRRSPLASELTFRPVVVLVDPEAWLEAKGDPKRPARFSFVTRQIEGADHVYASRCDLASEASLEAFEDWISGVWPAPLDYARIVDGQLSDTALDWGPKRPAFRLRKASPAGHEALAVEAETWAWPKEERFSLQRLTQAVETLTRLDCDAKMERFKGVFHTDEGVYRIEWAGGRTTSRMTEYRRESATDLIISGVNPQVFARAKALLNAALLTDEEQALDTSCVEFVLPDGARVRFDRERLASLPDGVADLSELIPNRSGRAAAVRSIVETLDIEDGHEAIVVALDGYASPAVPTHALLNGFLLYEYAGAELPASKGGPFRLLIPGDAGPAGACSNVKGVAQFVLRATASA